MSEPNFEKLEKQFLTVLNKELIKTEEINAGGNNRLFCLQSTDSQKYLAKFYYKDERPRLFNEFMGLSFMKDKGFRNIPTAFFKNDELNFAVYSFEEGSTKPNDKITKKDLDLMVDFLVKLEGFDPGQLNIKFNKNFRGHWCLWQYLENAQKKLEKFSKTSEYLNDNASYLKFKQKYDIKNIIYNEITKIIDEIGNEKLKKNIDENMARLGCTDFGADNVLYDKSGKACFIDFEDFTCNNPLETIADFINHIKKIDLSEENKSYFLLNYKKKSNLPDHFLVDIDLTVRLDLIEWLSTFLFWITPEKLQARKFANVKFNEKKYIDQAFANLEIYIKKLS